MAVRGNGSWSKLILGVAALLCIGVTAGIGSFLGQRLAGPNSAAALPMNLKAATGARADSLSICTGAVDGNVEALFVLDHLTGNLQCWMLNPRTGAIGAIYRANVMADLGVDKAGKHEFVMATGNFFWDGGVQGNNLPGQSIVYIADANSGNVVGYGVVYNKQNVKRGGVQGGPMRLVCVGKARGASVERDQ